MNVRKVNRGFTLVELLVVVIIITILAIITIVAYNGLQYRSADSVVQNSISQAARSLEYVNSTYDRYPSNLAGADYAAPDEVAMSMYTDAPQTPRYQGLTASENAQLFLNTCNGNMPIIQSGTTYNTACAYNGNNAHIKGQNASNIVIHGPQFSAADFILRCGSLCDSVRDTILQQFNEQGGTFPITVPKKQVALPVPTLVTEGSGTRYCLEARSVQYDRIVYHALSGSSAVLTGSCPNDTELHYP